MPNMAAPSPAPRSAGMGPNLPVATPTQAQVNGITSATGPMPPSGPSGGASMSGGGGGAMSQQNLNHIVGC